MEERQEARSRAGGGWIAAGAVVLVLCGVALIGVAVASQRTRVEPAIGVATESVTRAAAEEPSQALRIRATVELPESKPASLDIPAIDVHSVVRELGRTPEGTLETPQPGPRYNDAAWYRHSPTPGELGPAILLGHVDSASEGPSVFFRLGELRAGDRVSVTRRDGSVARFVVDKVRRYPKADFPTDLVYGDIDHAGLRILTCGGPFDEVAGHYLDNIVVFASLEGSSH